MRGSRSLVTSAVVFAALLLSAQVGAAEPGTRGQVQFLNSPDAPTRDLPFSEAVRVGDLIFVSGQIGSDAKMKPVPGGIDAEARQALKNIRTILERNGASLKDVVKCTVFLADIGEWPAFNKVYQETFTKPYPARSALGANGLALGARVEVECIAAVPASR
jgi:2-iminobutanoate/2-iminopropanoate deaminase